MSAIFMTKNDSDIMAIFKLSARVRITLLVFALIALIGPNGMFLYNYFTNPILLDEANANPIALAFMIEAMMMMGLFLVFVWVKTKSALQVILYVVLTFIGSLAFSFAFFLFTHSLKDRKGVAMQ